jgi:uncharacterized protein (DUF1684 family)
MTDWEASVRREREAEAHLFAQHPWSPVPPDQRPSFDGPDYFPPDDSYRFDLPLHEFDVPETVRVETTTGGERPYYRCGEFRFTVGDEECTLTAYRSDPSTVRLWIPFRDETNGEGSYAAGRYLDLVPQDRTTNSWLLDFNHAYNPLCAYSDEYECPLIPAQNALDVRIEAGEKAP